MIESVITAKSQTTLPSGVRKALGVGPGDRLAYVVEGDRAIITKAPPATVHEDPVAEQFLAFLERSGGKCRGANSTEPARASDAVPGSVPVGGMAGLAVFGHGSARQR